VEHKKGEEEWCVYYSKEQFEEYINCLEEIVAPVPSEDFRKDCPRIMKPIAFWCEMAMSALPFTKAEYEDNGCNFWLGKSKEYIDDITEKLENKQKKLSDYKVNSTKCFLSLPGQLVDEIAENSVFSGTDVRVSFEDDEDATVEFLLASQSDC
jgi:hypothetical protein